MTRCAVTFVTVLCAFVTGRGAHAARVPPADATVYIRLIGHVRVLRGDDERVRREVLAEENEVEVSTGSGFIVSPNGWVVTNHHVITGGKFLALLRGEQVEVVIDVNRIEVVLPGDSRTSGGARHFTASVYASDPELDLAVLYVGAQDLPYVALGDSDAMASADAVEAIGYPFGAELEIARPGASEAPAVSVSTGGVSALRKDDEGNVRFIQVSAPLNPGNSGGPIVDAEGYAVGVAQMKLRDGTAIGFAIPINLVKGMLQRHSLDQHLPVALLSLGPYLDAPHKALRVRVPYGFEDTSPVRARMDTGQSSESPAFRVDRVPSRWTLEQLEAALLSGGALEGFRASVTDERSAELEGGRRVVRSSGTGTDPDTGAELKVVYAVVDLGREKVVARYIGGAEAVAINRSVLTASLESLEARALLTAEVTQPLQPRWVEAALPGGSTLPLPEGWTIEPGAPIPCVGLPATGGSIAASPTGDFTVALRAAWRAGGDIWQAARACSSRSGRGPEGSYASRIEWLGTAYDVTGRFVSRENGTVWQLELLVPVEKSTFVGDLLTSWTQAVAHPHPATTPR